MVEPLFWGFIFGTGTVLMAGLRRFAWRYALVEAVGVGLVFALLRGWPGMSAEVAVLFAAIGGALASLAAERGERDRERRVAEILRGSSIPG